MCKNRSISLQEEGKSFVQDDSYCRDFAVIQLQSGPPQLIVCVCIINVILSIASGIANTLVISVIWKTPALRSPSIVLLSGLATADFAVAVVAQPLFLAIKMKILLTSSESDTCDLGMIFGITVYVTNGASLMTVTAISLDRLLAIRYDLRYPSIVTIPRVIYAISLSWLISGFLATLFLWTGYDTYLIVTLCGIAICFSFCKITHLRIYRIVCRHQRQIQMQVEAVQEGNRSQMARFKKTTVNAFLIHYCLLLYYTPLITLKALISRFKGSLEFESWYRYHGPIAWNLSVIFLFMNSSLNPLIYCWRLREMRLAVKGTLKSVLCKN